MTRRLKAAVVHMGRRSIVGQLFLKTPWAAVLVNHVPQDLDLGPFRQRRDKHLVPECSVTVIPQAVIDRLEILE